MLKKLKMQIIPTIIIYCNDIKYPREYNKNYDIQIVICVFKINIIYKTSIRRTRFYFFNVTRY